MVARSNCVAQIARPSSVKAVSTGPQVTREQAPTVVPSVSVTAPAKTGGRAVPPSTWVVVRTSMYGVGAAGRTPKHLVRLSGCTEGQSSIGSGRPLTRGVYPQTVALARPSFALAPA